MICGCRNVASSGSGMISGCGDVNSGSRMIPGCGNVKVDRAQSFLAPATLFAPEGLGLGFFPCIFAFLICFLLF